ncbi:P-loop containing nucleoside triphosphate hydrolase protein [Crassisporium funariophilum]|nr:P-loop containing nucleoside triphosphate hydrolase protein [Crassisporium funariophilum]
MQLRAILADRLGKESLISAGTGSGKTLPIAINILLDDPSKNLVTLTISPLTRLQATQEQDFVSRYGIQTFAINDHTPCDDTWWTTNIYSSGRPIKLPAQHLIITVEQLFVNGHGHLSRIGNLVRTPKFQKLIVRINVDEAHFFYTAGFPLFGAPAFRPAWEKLAGLKVLLRPSIRWHMFSATFPPHILTHVKERLLKPSFEFIQQTSNRPNLIYATHQVPGKLDDLCNYECFLSTPFDLSSHPHILIFVDDKALTSKITNHLDACLPLEYCGKGIVKHYHSGMSTDYLEQTHGDFVSPTGTCKILVTTSGQSVGVDFPNVKIVATIGLPPTIVDALQRGGRGIRVGDEHALFVVFNKSWALEIDEDEFMEGTDPDRPRTKLGIHSRAQERAPLLAIQLVRSRTCLRKFYADYLDDHAVDALKHLHRFCCDCHNNGFDLGSLLPGRLFTDEIPAEETKAARAVSTYRPKTDRAALERR